MRSPLHFTKEDFNCVEEEFGLRNFLEVSAPDKDGGYLYYNEKGQGLFETFPHNSKLHKQQDGEELSFTDDKNQVFKVAKREPYLITNQKRLAQDEKDFQEIYNREFELSELNDNEEEHFYFKQTILPKKVSGLIDIHARRVGDTNINASTTFLANRFLDYLKDNSRKAVQNKAKESTTLKGLFKNPEEYFRIVEAIKEEGIFIEDGGHLSLNNLHLQENHLEKKRAICAFGYLLTKGNYLEGNDNQLSESLSSLFQIPISKQTYSQAKNKCFLIQDDKAMDYFALFYLVS